MTPTRATHKPLTLQARLMAAVIGFVSLILIIVALITSATLGRTLEDQLNGRLQSTSEKLTVWVEQQALFTLDVDAESVLQTVRQQNPGLLLAFERSPDIPATGAISDGDGISALDRAQLRTLAGAVQAHAGTVSIDDLGSYSILTTQTERGITVITGLPRDEIQSTLTALFTVIAMATLGGLILLALTTAITIRVSLRPLRAVTTTAVRVANLPLDRGEVSITERVPATEADPRTETGVVGAALNTLLDHVDSSLAARQRNEERMRRFVADASHELRTPLASIRGYSELSLRDHSLPETTTTALERIQAQSLRMASLVEDLLLLARLDEGRELVRGTVDLTRLALESVADARPTAPDHHWSIDVPSEPVTVVGDAGRLHQVVTNLLANARTHTPAGTHVDLSLAVQDGQAIIRVHDDGPGIDPSVREEMFARFARGDASRTRQTGGTGLGLAIVKAIVEGHGGTIEVDSRPGSTTFSVRLPAPPAAPSAAAEAPRT